MGSCSISSAEIFLVAAGGGRNERTRDLDGWMRFWGSMKGKGLRVSFRVRPPWVWRENFAMQVAACRNKVMITGTMRMVGRHNYNYNVSFLLGRFFGARHG